MSLKIQGDDLMTLGERRQVRPEHLERAQPTVQQNQGPASPVDFIVKLEAVDVRIVALSVGLASPRALGFASGLGVAPNWGGDDRRKRYKRDRSLRIDDCSRC